MHRFWAQEAALGAEVRFPGDEARHAEKVLRLLPGARIEILSGGGRFLAEYLGGDRAMIVSALSDNEPPVRAVVYMGMPKADKLEFVCQKATELGAAAIVPVKMTRSVAVWDARDVEKRTARLSRIAFEAAKQCGRARAPEVLPPVPLKEALAAFSGDLLLMPWEEEGQTSLRAVHSDAPGARHIGVLIGPEGGIAQEEAALAASRGARAVTLGPRILRAETAAVAALSLIMGLWGDLL